VPLEPSICYKSVGTALDESIDPRFNFSFSNNLSTPRVIVRDKLLMSERDDTLRKNVASAFTPYSLATPGKADNLSNEYAKSALKASGPVTILKAFPGDFFGAGQQPRHH
jgi:hypothetical protein